MEHNFLNLTQHSDFNENIPYDIEILHQRTNPYLTEVGLGHQNPLNNYLYYTSSKESNITRETITVSDRVYGS